MSAEKKEKVNLVATVGAMVIILAAGVALYLVSGIWFC